MIQRHALAFLLALGGVAAACGDDDEPSDDSQAGDGDGDGADDDADDSADDGEMMDASTPDDGSDGEDDDSDGDDGDDGPDQSTCVPMFADAGAECNALEGTATAVAIAAADGDAPVGTGGTILAGKYWLTAATAYEGSALPVGVSIAQDLEVCGGIVQIVQVIAATTEHVTATIAPDGTAPNLAEVCTTKDPDATVWSSYTAEGGTFTLYSAAGKMSLTYTMQ